LVQSALYREPQLLDSKLHRHKKLKVLSDFSITRQMHAVFLSATEFPQASLDLPIIFITTSDKTADGKPVVSPVVLLGVTPGENLRLDGERWDARYLPAFIRRFPFLTAGVQGSDSPGVFVDVGYAGFSDTEGEALFDDQGKPTAFLQGALDFLQRFDEEQRRTRAFCDRLVELDLLKEMAAEAEMPAGGNVKIEGFLAVDEDKLNKLPDAVVLELHRSGMLMLVHTHLVSLSNIRDLVGRKAVQIAKTQAPTATA
jgi:hypothetical protein